MRRVVQIAAMLAIVASVVAIPWVGAQTGSADAFQRTWARTDKPVNDHQVDRTWMWGPQETAIETTEPYAEAPGGQRTVVYYDKSRMEDNSYRGSDPWDVTNGLLVVELITGQMQTGDDTFVPRDPAGVNVAGDPNQTNPITYALLADLLDAPAATAGSAITARGTVTDSGIAIADDPSLAGKGVTAAWYVPDTDHTVASPFWTFMNSSGIVYEGDAFTTEALFENPFYATGFPITEAFWANVTVNGTAKDVLLQCFERRCLTYTPDNAPGWQVEAGNVGLHYYEWRHGEEGGGQTPSPTPTPDPNAIYQSNLTNWPVVTDNSGNSAYPTYEDYRIRTVRGADMYAISDVALGEGSYRVRVSNVSGGDTTACLAIRAERHPTARTFPKRSTNFCLIYENGQAREATAFIQTINSDNTTSTSTLGSWGLPTPIAAGDWTQLRIDAFGNDMTYLVNGAQLGTSGGQSATGLLALASYSDDASHPVTVAFRDMLVRRTP
ncbi:MAG TPA: hypothetical protein VFV93_15800 [Thermomicrobiales bacterium]|nr:hypothetical protein [Thermomicrobiales bacterium]